MMIAKKGQRKITEKLMEVWRGILYNNSGYVLLAMVIEKITGMYFDQYLRENIFDICGMKSTAVDVKGTGAGGAFITVKDIISFWTYWKEI